ncbi:unnamed protein product, partial [marine sediment metagenome]
VYNAHNFKYEGYHQPMLIGSSEIIKDEKLRMELIDKCWVYERWSASISPRGAFFCEVACALDHLFDLGGGWRIKKGWWKRSDIDDDDIWTEDHLKRLLDFALSRNLEFVSSTYDVMENGVKHKQPSNDCKDRSISFKLIKKSFLSSPTNREQLTHRKLQLLVTSIWILVLFCNCLIYLSLYDNLITLHMFDIV